MDPHGLSVCAVMVCLLGATRLSSGDKCRCPEIPPKDFTVREGGCFNSTYRYKCIEGYTRKAGTSNLIKCLETDGVLHWFESSVEKFKCIVDPNYKPPPATTAHPTFRTHPTISTEAPPGPSSTSKPSAPPKTEQSTLGPSSTLRTSTSNPSLSPHTLGETTTVCISLIAVVLLVVCAVVFFLCRQRKKPNPPRDPEEQEAEKLAMI